MGQCILSGWSLTDNLRHSYRIASCSLLTIVVDGYRAAVHAKKDMFFDEAYDRLQICAASHAATGD
jgi:hypothetical protein